MAGHGRRGRCAGGVYRRVAGPWVSPDAGRRNSGVATWRMCALLWPRPDCRGPTRGPAQSAARVAGSGRAGVKPHVGVAGQFQPVDIKDVRGCEIEAEERHFLRRLKRHKLAIHQPCRGYERLSVAKKRLGAPVAHKQKLASRQGHIPFGPRMPERARHDPHRRRAQPVPSDATQDRRAAIAGDHTIPDIQIGNAPLAIEGENDAVGQQAACVHRWKDGQSAI
ncbi:hypothetical protein RV420_400162 [Roseovarius sp. EC-SD190]|nr:hypothetical protein RV420_400162 [Roseovarius sp. EC-SD190]